jgi:hypothetical protein
MLAMLLRLKDFRRGAVQLGPFGRRCAGGPGPSWRIYEQETLRERPLRRQARHAVGDGRHQPLTYEYDGRSGDIDLMLWPVHRESHSIGRPKGRPYLGIFALLICLEPRDRISFDPFPRLGFAVETAICLFATGECDANIPAWLGRGVAWPRVNTPPMTERSTHRIFSAAPQPRGGP